MLDSLFRSLSVLQPYLLNSGWLFTAFIGIAFGLLAFSILYLLNRAVSPVRRRLDDISTDSNGPVNSRSKKIDRSLKPVKHLIVPTKQKELSAISLRMVRAGYNNPEAITVYYMIKILLVISLSIIGGLIVYWFFNGSTQTITLGIFIGAAVGMLLPSYFIDKKTAARQTEILNSFPDVLDLLVACSEAGLGLNAGIQRVAKETNTMYPVLSSELEMVNSEVRAGVDRIEALRGLSTRTGVEDISGFVSMISQSVKFGTSIADTLRIYSEEFRDKRMQRAEEKAAKVSTKLIFPLVICIFPSFFAVAIGPAVISIVRAFQALGQ